ncbi:MAG: DNA replication/repair protein RecF [Azospirillaceae bacterium]
MAKAVSGPGARMTADGQTDGRPTGQAAAVAVARLTLTDFRSYRHAGLATGGRSVVLTGANGAGKTNILEAISFLAPGRGLRRAPLADVARRSGNPPPADGTRALAAWAVAAEIDLPTGPVRIGTGLDPEAPPGMARRVVRINGAPAANQSDLGAFVSIQWLTPQMDRLFIEGSSQRRRFFDRMVYGFHPGHAVSLNAYEQAMRERTRLLREARPDGRWLSALEETMAGHAMAVAAARRDTASRLARAIASAQDSAFPRARLTLTGTLESWLDAMPALAAEDRFRETLAQRRPIDTAAGAATEGPHRSDLAVAHAPKDMPAALCSTGEQKALLTGLVLANARLMAADRGAPPLLLLDEVAAHLDAERRAALFDAVLDLGGQAWLTGTDRSLFRALEDRALFVAVAEGHLAPDAPGRPGPSLSTVED